MAQYSRSIFTFIDVLGFREIVRGTTDPSAVASMLRFLQHMTRPSTQTTQLLDMKFMTFSDCTVRSVPIYSEQNKAHPVGILWHELMDLVFVQAELIHRGSFLRGALTIGDVCFDDSLVFGPAMVTAYTLESEFASNPRIVIDPCVFAELESEPLLRNRIHSLEDEKGMIRELVRKDSDGLYFVDYLNAILGNLDAYDGDLSFLRTHKYHILRAASKLTGLTRISAKLLWLASYHNTVVDELGSAFFVHRESNIKDYWIGRKEMTLLCDLDA